MAIQQEVQRGSNAVDDRGRSSVTAPFMVSAPGKVILYGEHAVVYGKAAIAAAISLRSYLLVTFLPKSSYTVRLQFPDIGLDHAWSIDSLPWLPFSQPAKKKCYYDSIGTLDPELLVAMKPHIASISPNLPEHTRKIHQAAASSFLYLFLSLGSPKSASCVYTLRSTIPIGAGLGSSASIAVCVSAALLLQTRALSGPHADQPSPEAALQIERINRWAFVSEMCIHGAPSGVDNTVSSGGKAILFRRPDTTSSLAPALPTMIRLQNFPELPLLLVNTRQSRRTANEVAKVAQLKTRHPGITRQLLEAINDVTESAFRLISADGFDPHDATALQHLGDLIAINHGLLVSLGVSHPKLERIRELIDHAGIGWTKLTGAGGGGCAITILKPERAPASMGNGAEGTTGNAVGGGVDASPSARRDQATVLRDLEKSLEDEGFQLFESSLTGQGVGVLWPALTPSGGYDGEEGGEITQEKFLGARGNEEIERLVGMNHGLHGGDGDGDGDGGNVLGWEFWRL